MKNSKYIKILIMIIPLLCFLLFLFREAFIDLFLLLPPCPYYRSFHLYCPSCGLTRSSIALLQGDLLASIRFHILPVILLLFAMSAYLELVFIAFYRRIKLLPRKPIFYIAVITLLLVYSITRNL